MEHLKSNEHEKEREYVHQHEEKNMKKRAKIKNNKEKIWTHKCHVRI